MWVGRVECSRREGMYTVHVNNHLSIKRYVGDSSHGGPSFQGREVGVGGREGRRG